MRKTLIALVIASVALVGAACDREDTNTNVNSTTNTTTNTAANTNTSTTNNTNTSSNTNSGEFSTGTSISVTEPAANATVDETFSVKGTSQASTVYVRVKSANGNTITTVPVTVRNGSWVINRLTINATNSTTGTLEIYEKSGDNEVNLVRVPIKFAAANDSAGTSENVNTSEDNTNMTTDY